MSNKWTIPLELGDRVKMIKDARFWHEHEEVETTIKGGEIGEVVSFGTSSQEPESWYSVEFGDLLAVDITFSQVPELLEIVERYEEEPTK